MAHVHHMAILPTSNELLRIAFIEQKRNVLSFTVHIVERFYESYGAMTYVAINIDDLDGHVLSLCVFRFI